MTLDPPGSPDSPAGPDRPDLPDLPVAPRARMLTLLSLGFSVPFAIVIGGGAGWLLDRWLGTAPWLFLIFLAFGIVAGLRNVIRAASSAASLDARAERTGEEPP